MWQGEWVAGDGLLDCLLSIGQMRSDQRKVCPSINRTGHLTFCSINDKTEWWKISRLRQTG